MKCDCAHLSTKQYARLDPGQNPPAVLGRVLVQIDSSCEEIPQSGEGNGENFFIGHSPTDRAKSFDRQAQRGEAGGQCFNYIDVTLIMATANWTITEVKVGDDVFAAAIAAGKTERFVLGPCESCEKEPASVKVSDANGKVQATIAGLKACHCQSA